MPALRFMPCVACIDGSCELVAIQDPEVVAIVVSRLCFAPPMAGGINSLDGLAHDSHPSHRIDTCCKISSFPFHHSLAVTVFLTRTTFFQDPEHATAPPLSQTPSSMTHPSPAPRPTPDHTLTIPSLSPSNATLECRIYLPIPHPRFRPQSSSPNSQRHPPSPRSRRRRGAVVAHPYGPLGGSFDDVVVCEVVRALLEDGDGWVVCTFNFR